MSEQNNTNAVKEINEKMPIENIEKILGNIFYNIGRQQYNFEVCCLTKEGAKSKWKKYLDIQNNKKFLERVNNRTILPNEIVIDVDHPEKFQNILTKIRKIFKYYLAYRTGSRGYHIHIFFNRELSKEEKLAIITRFGGDVAKASIRTMIALEDAPHWKTGKPKTLIEGNFGIENAEVYDFPKIYYNFECNSTNPNAVLNLIEKNFPMMSFYVECCLSCIMCLLIEDLAAPVGLNLEGAPSSEKTTILEFFAGIIELIFKSDLFTSKSFVSHSFNASEEELKEIDLLPKIRNKVFLVLELAPLLGKRKEDLLENLAVLTRLFDGQGLETDSGARGHRGYTGDYLFIWLGATTPLATHVWNVMGKLGQRFLFLKLPNKNKTNNELTKVMTEKSYKKKVTECREEVHNLIKYIFNDIGSLYSINWDKEKDDKELLEWIVSLAKLLGSLRAPIEIYTNGYDKEEYQFKTPVKEEPERAISLLYDIARGHAILYGRNYVTMDDARVIFEIAFSSCPYDRYKLIELFINNNSCSFNANSLSKLMNCSDRNARTIIKTMEILGLGKITEFHEERDNVGRPAMFFTLLEEYSNLLNKLKELRQAYDVNAGSENNFGTKNDAVCNRLKGGTKEHANTKNGK